MNAKQDPNIAAVSTALDTTKSRNKKGKTHIEIPKGTRVRDEFKVRFNNLEADIKHVNTRLDHVQQFVLLFENQIDHLKNLIKNDKGGKRAHYYTLMNSAMDLNSRYEELYIKLMDLKHKYRKEEDDLNIKVAKMVEVDISRLSDEDDDALTPAKLSNILQMLTRQIDQQDDKAKEITQSFHDLEQDPDYKL